MFNFSKPQTRNDLDFLLSNSPSAQASLAEKLTWLGQILHWALSESPLKLPEHDFSTGHTQALRLRWILFLLDRNPEWKNRLSQVLSAVVAETQIFDLLLSGLHQKSGIFAESMQRLSNRLLPQMPDDKNLGLFLPRIFESQKDALALMKVDPQNFKKLIELFTTETQTDFSIWKENAREAVRYLALQIAALGQSDSMRKLIPYSSIQENPFYLVNSKIMNWKDILSLGKFHFQIEKCNQAIDDLHSHMDDHGVSVDMVYQLERLRFLLRRLKRLLLIFDPAQAGVEQTQKLISLIILENIRSKSLLALFDDNTILISKKIAENSAETGEHYIAHNRAEYIHLFQSSVGGGALTAITTVVKFVIAALPGSPFIHGFFSSLNYSISFLALQVQHFTLATKQPAMTAAYISQKLHPEGDNVDLTPAVQEIFHVIRSQFVTVIGNATSVIPSVMFICAGFEWLRGTPFLSETKALHVIESMSILGPTPFYAIFTGVLLFTSSLCSGWFYHWVRYRNLPQALAKNPRLIKWFGPEKARLFSQIFKRNSAGIAANISLGLLLGFAPFLASFFGLPLDVRHVTLSIGSITTAVMTLGTPILSQGIFLQAVLGILSMAIFNIFVSFTLALLVALRSKQVSLKLSLQLFKAIFSEAKKSS